MEELWYSHWYGYLLLSFIPGKTISRWQLPYESWYLININPQFLHVEYTYSNPCTFPKDKNGLTLTNYSVIGNGCCFRLSFEYGNIMKAWILINTHHVHWYYPQAYSLFSVVLSIHWYPTLHSRFRRVAFAEEKPYIWRKISPQIIHDCVVEQNLITFPLCDSAPSVFRAH